MIAIGHLYYRHRQSCEIQVRRIVRECEIVRRAHIIARQRLNRERVPGGTADRTEQRTEPRRIEREIPEVLRGPRRLGMQAESDLRLLPEDGSAPIQASAPGEERESVQATGVRFLRLESWPLSDPVLPLAFSNAVTVNE